MNIRPVHPFPARMAPELALNSLKSLPKDSRVLDPMVGSGTVLRQAAVLGHRALGFDVDPLAVLMSGVATTPVPDADIGETVLSVVEEAQGVDLGSERVQWHDDETSAFVGFWFGEAQQVALSRLAIVLARRLAVETEPDRLSALNVLRLSLSRIVITKEPAASLARDTSHSRPHRVTEVSDYDVWAGFSRSVQQVRKRLLACPPPGHATIDFGDARALKLADGSIDAVVTSPPYLNAIDYMRGHRLALVWLGYSIRELRAIRSDAIGAERAISGSTEVADISKVTEAMGAVSGLEPRLQRVVSRYAKDLLAMTTEVSRLLRVGGVATFVVGNSCLRDVFISNSDGLCVAAERANLDLIRSRERELPQRSRYLPVTLAGSLSKRMRTETVLTFSK